MGSTSNATGLKFEAYKQEQPTFAMVEPPKETTAGNPVFANPAASQQQQTD